jgi:hypothetical protein
MLRPEQKRKAGSQRPASFSGSCRRVGKASVPDVYKAAELVVRPARISDPDVLNRSFSANGPVALSGDRPRNDVQTLCANWRLKRLLGGSLKGMAWQIEGRDGRERTARILTKQ